MRSEAEPLRRAAAYEQVIPIKREEVQNGAYLLHFAEPVPYEKANRYGDERHYVGASTDIFKRIAQHKMGKGSLMTKMAVNMGINLTLVGIFPNAKASYIESIITKVGATRFCPMCNEDEYLKWKTERENNWRNLHPKARENIIKSNRAQR